jgi:hypothetical protein
VVMASGHGRRRGGRLARAMIRRDCLLCRHRRHRKGGGHRGERAREQDQQQEFGGPANHVFRIRKRGAPLPSVHPHTRQSLARQKRNSSRYLG